MAGGGGKGGSTTTEVKVPEYFAKAAEQNLDYAGRAADVGYVPYSGPEIAAFSPAMTSAFDNTNDMAGAYGLKQADYSNGYGVPAPTRFADGSMGYSTMPAYNRMMEQFARDRPAQKQAIDDFFINPLTGRGGPSSYNPYVAPEVAQAEAARAAAAKANANPYPYGSRSYYEFEIGNGRMVDGRGRDSMSEVGARNRGGRTTSQSSRDNAYSGNGGLY